MAVSRAEQDDIHQSIPVEEKYIRQAMIPRQPVRDTSIQKPDPDAPAKLGLLTQSKYRPKSSTFNKKPSFDPERPASGCPRAHTRGTARGGAVKLGNPSPAAPPQAGSVAAPLSIEEQTAASQAGSGPQTQVATAEKSKDTYSLGQKAGAAAVVGAIVVGGISTLSDAVGTFHENAPATIDRTVINLDRVKVNGQIVPQNPTKVVTRALSLKERVGVIGEVGRGIYLQSRAMVASAANVVQSTGQIVANTWRNNPNKLVAAAAVVVAVGAVATVGTARAIDYYYSKDTDPQKAAVRKYVADQVLSGKAGEMSWLERKWRSADRFLTPGNIEALIYSDIAGKAQKGDAKSQILLAEAHQTIARQQRSGWIRPDNRSTAEVMVAGVRDVFGSS